MGTITKEEATSEEIDLQTIRLPFFRRNNPFIQVLLMGGCLFCNPGLYLAVLGLGAGGGKASSTTMSDTANGVLYGTFIVTGILGGTILNTLGPRITTLFSITGYPLYIGGFWYFDQTGKLWYPVFGGAYLGICAGCMWAVTGFMTNAYPEEKDKGVWRAVLWSFLSAGAAAGGLVTLGINLHSNLEGVPESVYIIFISIQCVSIIFALLMVPPSTLIRPDGTPVITRQANQKETTISESLHGLFELLKDWRIIILLPTFFAPEVFLVLQSSMNAYAYNLRTRSLNSTVAVLIQIPFVFGLGYLLDYESLGSRRRRAMIAVSLLTIFTAGMCIAQTIWLHSWKFDRSIAGPGIDWTDEAYPGALVIYMSIGVEYGCFQSSVLWVLGAMTNDPKKLAHLGGLFIGVLSIGTAVTFGIDATVTPYERENGALFAISMIALFILFFAAAKFVPDTNYFKEEGVGIPVHVRREYVKAAGQVNGLAVSEVRGSGSRVKADVETRPIV